MQYFSVCMDGHQLFNYLNDLPDLMVKFSMSMHSMENHVFMTWKACIVVHNRHFVKVFNALFVHAFFFFFEEGGSSQFKKG